MTLQLSEPIQYSTSSYLRPTRLTQVDEFREGPPPTPLIFSPLPGQCFYATEVVVKGYTISDICGGIEHIELSLDGGQTWVDADVAPNPQPGEWRLWRKQLTLQPGHYDLLARVGNNLPGIGSRWHQVGFEVIP